VNTRTLKTYASELCGALLRGRYKGKAFAKGRELYFDLAVLSFLTAKGYQVQRQLSQRYGGKNGRIDFRTGPVNPVFIEFACRTNQKSPSLSAASNRNEINKLSWIATDTRGRNCLLLLDLAKTPIPRDDLANTYHAIRFRGPTSNRNSVTVVYGHSDIAFSFRWDP
jgi:hypothetical protein